MEQNSADIQRIEIVNEDDDTSWSKWVPFLYYTVECIAVYYMMRPDKLEQHKQLVRDTWHRLQHRVSVWKAREAIHSLPTIDITDITGE